MTWSDVCVKFRVGGWTDPDEAMFFFSIRKPSIFPLNQPNSKLNKSVWNF